MSDVVWWEPPFKVGNTWVLRLHFKNQDDAIEFMAKNGIVGPNSYDHAMDMWQQYTQHQIKKETKGVRAKFKKWFSKR